MYAELIDMQIALAEGGYSGAVVPIYIHTRRLIRLLTSVVALLVTAHFAVMFAKYHLGHDHLLGLVRMFDLLNDANVPTWYSSSTLFICAGLLLAIGLSRRGDDRFAPHWIGLALVMAYVSVDEAAKIHETVQARLRVSVDTMHPFYPVAAIVLPGLLVAGVAMAYGRFVMALPAGTRRLFITAAVLFISGGLLFDFVTELHTRHHGHDNMTAAALTAVEETLEMAGVLVMIYALLDYIHRHVGSLDVRVADER